MIHIDRRLIKNFDWVTLSIVIVIVFIGILTIYSATRPVLEEDGYSFYIRQAIWLIFGIAGLFLMVSFDYIRLSRLSIYLYIIGFISLISVFIFGREGMGAQRWISLGPLSFQPSEFFKLFYVIMLSHQLSSANGALRTIHFFRLFFLVVFIPFVLLLKQPDLGTALIILTIFLSLTLARGIQRKILILFIIIGIISLPFIGTIFWEGLKDYQKNRIIAFMEPGVDPTGIGYHINQSKITVGSGKLFGKGYLKGTQGPFRFLPEKHTDFIFAVFSEEWGFLGSISLLSLYMLIILRGLKTAIDARDDFGRYLALGITFMFLIYCIVNIGMTLGIMPVVGIPLPFMSYGGTALLSNLISLGILINIRTRRFELFH
ncbi:MAG: rod shape-determining protein RodA [Nitrospirae bacterium]|nr:rod shape-determining protein RodA [Nitrospirota bacterium]